MTRLLVHVEGETEEIFVNEILGPHLQNFGYSKVSARIFGNARQRDRRGGVRAWSSVQKDIVNHLKEDAVCIATTMVDFTGFLKQVLVHGRVDRQLKHYLLWKKLLLLKKSC